MLIVAALCLLVGAEPDELPPLSDLDRFPPLYVAEDMYRFYAAHEAWIQAQMAARPDSGPWGELQADNYKRRRAWQLFCFAHGGGGQVGKALPTDKFQRQVLLHMLQTLVGVRDYAAGQMPFGLDP